MAQETMTLAELQAETLAQKNRRLRQAKCKHPADAIFESSFVGPQGSFTDRVCLDCGKHWRADQ